MIERVFEAKFPQIMGMQSNQTQHTYMPVKAHISEVIFFTFSVINHVNPILFVYNLMAQN